MSNCGDICERCGVEVESCDCKASKRCPDCGEPGEVRGHMTCQYPTTDEEANR